jgi:hypothetical protein
MGFSECADVAAQRLIASAARVVFLITWFPCPATSLKVFADAALAVLCFNALSCASARTFLGPQGDLLGALFGTVTEPMRLSTYDNAGTAHHISTPESCHPPYRPIQSEADNRRFRSSGK